jgi:hypothetical protein
MPADERGAAWHKADLAVTEATFQAQTAADYLGLLRAIGPNAARVTDEISCEPATIVADSMDSLTFRADTYQIFT